MEEDANQNETLADTFAEARSEARTTPFTMGRIMNGVLAGVCVAALICCIVCVGVMASKHNQIIDNRDPGHTQPQSDKEVCILFTTVTDEKHFGINQTVTTVWTPRYNKSHTCQFVIFGSGIIGGLLLIAAGYFVLRLFIMRSINTVIFLELSGFAVLSVFMFSVSVVISAGRAFTCGHMTKDPNFGTCGDVAIYYNNNPDSDAAKVYIYSALKTSEVSSWISFLLLLGLVIVSVVKTVVWYMRRKERQKDERQLNNLISPVGDEDDDEDPLPM